MSHVSLQELQYPIFESNQVLSSYHLNQLRAFLEGEDLATRRRAIGTGWLGGADMQVIPQGQGLEAIRLSCGAGITSYGYLATVEDCRLEYARDYSDPFKNPTDDENAVQVPGYDPFWGPDNSDRRVQKPVIELFTEAEADTLRPAEKTAARQRFISLNPRDLIVLVYVESDQRDIRSCVLEDCNERGQRVLVKSRVLAINKSLVQPADFNPRHASSGLMPLRLLRVLDYTGADLEALYRPVFIDAVPAFAQGFSTACAYFARHLGFEARQWSQAEIAAQLNAHLQQLTADRQQIFYDFLRDLVSAYNRFLEVGLALATRPCPDEHAFPRHLYLGEMTPDRRPLGDTDHHVPPQPYLKFRHYFEGPAEPTGQANALARLRGLYRRIELMLARFRTNPVSVGPRMLPQKTLSPSSYLVPYYYDLATAEGAELKALWCHPAHEGATVPALVYHYRDLAANHSNNPLGRTIDGDGMIRTEGLYGADAEDTAQAVRDLANHFGLAVDVRLVYRRGPLPAAPAAPYDAAQFAYDYAALSSDWLHVLHGCAVSLRTAVARNSHWLAFLALPPPDAGPVQEMIAKLDQLLLKRVEDTDVDVLTRNYYRLLGVAAKYQSDLTRYMVEVTGHKLESPGLGALPGQSTQADKGGTPYHILATLALCDLKRGVYRLFEHLNANPLLMLLYRLDAERTQSGPDKRLFAEFYKKHRGLEHIAGFTRGSTFVLLADGGKIVGDFYLPYLCCCPCDEKPAYKPAPEVRPVYWDREWQAEIVLTHLDTLGAGTEVLLVDDQELKADGQRVPVAGDHASLVIKKIDGQPHLVLVSDQARIGSLITFMITAKGKRQIAFPCWVSLSPPLIIANDDSVVTVEDEPVIVPYYRNDLLPLGDLSNRRIVAEPKLGKAFFLNDELFYQPSKGVVGTGPLSNSGAGRAARQDQFDYEIIIKTGTGLELRSVATVTVHIVPCCGNDRPTLTPEPTSSPTTKPPLTLGPSTPPPFTIRPSLPPTTLPFTLSPVTQPPLTIVPFPPPPFTRAPLTAFPVSEIPAPTPTMAPMPVAGIMVVDDADFTAWKSASSNVKLRAISVSSEEAQFKQWGDVLAQLEKLIDQDIAGFKAGEFDTTLGLAGIKTLASISEIISRAMAGNGASRLASTGPVTECVIIVSARYVAERGAVTAETKELLGDAASLIKLAREAQVTFTDGFERELKTLTTGASNANVKKSLTLLARALA